MAIIEVEQLSKSFRTFKRREGVLGSVRDLLHREYRTLKAVDAISFRIEEGELIGYIGPNGAGKSTSIKMLTGILKPTSGRMSVMGFHPFYDRKDYARNIGVVFGQRTQLWWDIAVLESFKLLGNIYGVEQQEFRRRLEHLTEILDIGEQLHTPVRKLSLGQRMRCDLVASLIHSPRVLFLDEPTIGLDAVAKDSIRSFLRRINRELRTTILLTTHDLKEIEELCRRIIVLDRGHVLYDGDLASVRNLPGLERAISLDFPGEAPAADLEGLFPGRLVIEREGKRRVVGHYDSSKLPTGELLRSLVGRFDISEMTISEPSIEEVIVKLYREGAAKPLPSSAGGLQPADDEPEAGIAREGAR